MNNRIWNNRGDRFPSTVHIKIKNNENKTINIALE